MDAPTPRKSNRVPISLAAWLRALSTSWRSIRLTMSKEDSAGIGCSFSGRAVTDGREATARRVRAGSERAPRVPAADATVSTDLTAGASVWRGPTEARPVPGTAQPPAGRLRLPGGAGQRA